MEAVGHLDFDYSLSLKWGWSKYGFFSKQMGCDMIDQLSLRRSSFPINFNSNLNAI